tara:strand:+ start:1243 stop:3030 length:1788 start_codon:yes stop_codon:yes gene_type:complete
MRIKPHKSVEQIARKHRMDVSDIQKQLDMGVPIEHEHTRNKTLATDIALQHLDEIPDYYTRLKKMEASARKEHKKFKDVTEDAVTDLQRGITELPDASYGSIDGLMRGIMKKRKMTAKQLHNDFVDKHNQTPDTWAKRNMKEEKGLWDNIHARREKGLPRKKPGQKGYPKTLNIGEDLRQARKNVGASKCWPGKVAKGTKIKNGEEVPDCRPIKEESGVRYCPKCAKEETRDECKYGQKYWDMFSMPITLKDYTPNTPHPGNMPEEKDHEYSMARSELDTITNAAKRLKKKMKGEGNIEAWVQSKITKAADYIDTAADYIDSRESKVNEDTTIEDANGNTFLRIINIIRPESLKTTKGIGNRLVGESISSEPKLRPGSGLGGGKPVYPKGKEPKPTGAELPKLPLAKGEGGSPGQPYKAPKEDPKNPYVPAPKRPNVQLAHYESEGTYIEEQVSDTDTAQEKFDRRVNAAKAPGLTPALKVKILKSASEIHPSKAKTLESFMIEASAAWQRKEGKNPEGGLNKKGIASYRKENPGSHLSLAVTTKPSKLKKGSKSANRRKSFCSRMSGMKDKLTSAKTANDPNSRINKSLRKWNC